MQKAYIVFFLLKLKSDFGCGIWEKGGGWNGMGE